ncbi:OmpA family protein [Erythrobacter sp. sf7]|uniref:OmpA family protein n=1 Tax=Erythrobacter fulvus TaxID=2987523 RepID=A0ABT5JQA6_9SPHN|nr:OmpA family protein [Erythrobacter fulvus]MDC8754952.1 OmpA family protein [Erythrobacter fulvus]
MRLAKLALTSGIACSVFVGVPVSAQVTDASELEALGNDALVDELSRRYESALAVSLDDSVTSANDSRHLWALEAKVQCAIALGYMKSSTRDEPSIRKCARAYDLMSRTPRPPAPQVVPPPPPPPRRPDFCTDAGLVTVFFEFDSTEIETDAMTILDTVAQQSRTCGWGAISVVGHTDQAGSDQYNLGLSQERARVVAEALRAKVPASTQISVDAKGESNPRVPLADGTRSPENRRVEITVK